MKAGIVADNYKIERFKKELTKNGFTDFSVVPFINNTSSIQVIIPDDGKKLPEIKKICKEVELFFKHGN